MGLFKRSEKKVNGNPSSAADIEGIVNIPGAEINDSDTARFSVNGSHGLDSIYEFLQSDYESRGYNDALTNPDESYKADNITLFHHDLVIMLDRSSVFYEGLLKELDFHISSRSRAGLIDLVEELKIRKEVIADHLAKVKALKLEAESGTGAVQRIKLSYQRGFMRGLSAISQSKLFNRNL